MEIGDQNLPLRADLSTPCDLSLNAILFTQFVHKIAEGEAKEEIWSSVNYLFFISTSLIYGKDQYARYCVIKRFERCLGWR